jgi:hypothetical protein
MCCLLLLEFVHDRLNVVVLLFFPPFGICKREKERTTHSHKQSMHIINVHHPVLTAKTVSTLHVLAGACQHCKHPTEVCELL